MVSPVVMENQMEKIMENDMETGMKKGSRGVIV